MQFEDYEQNENSRNHCRKLGVAAALMMRSPDYQRYPVNCITAWIQPAIMLKQIRFFFDRHGGPVGYMTWAYLAPDVEERLLHDPRFMLHLSEWNEGENLWILDFLAPNGFAKAVVRYARESMFPSFEVANSVRRLDDGSIRSRCLWRRRGAYAT
jgi:cytolysin-activating lysine-acyltransferase